MNIIAKLNRRYSRTTVEIIFAAAVALVFCAAIGLAWWSR